VANNIKKTYILAIVNRDLEIFSKIKKFLLTNYNIYVVDLIKNQQKSFDIKALKKKLKKYPISFIILKLTTHKDNVAIYNTLQQLNLDIPILNSLNSVRTCESRKDTFQLLRKSCKNLKFPQPYFSKDQALKAISDGTHIIIKLDSHNPANLPKNDRIIGIAKNSKEFDRFIHRYKEEDLFFQEYLGRYDIINKVYIIGRWVVSIISHNRLNPNYDLSPLELVHIRVPIAEDFKRRIKRMGRKFGMSIYGVDYILTDKGPYIVDINDFPSFRAIPEGISLICDHIYNLINIREQHYKAKIKIKG
jgi:glutathione synthase/RimK-type ligase-like ATP-grasp enzyme